MLSQLIKCFERRKLNQTPAKTADYDEYRDIVPENKKKSLSEDDAALEFIKGNYLSPNEYNQITTARYNSFKAYVNEPILKICQDVLNYPDRWLCRQNSISRNIKDQEVEISIVYGLGNSNVRLTHNQERIGLSLKERIVLDVVLSKRLKQYEDDKRNSLSKLF